MNNYNTKRQDIYTVKRSIFNFSSKLSKGMQKPNRNFILDMLFGLAKGKSVVLADIAFTLEEPIDTIQTIKRLSSRFDKFHEDDQLLFYYGEIIQIQLIDIGNLIILYHTMNFKQYYNNI